MEEGYICAKRGAGGKVCRLLYWIGKRKAQVVGDKVFYIRGGTVR